VYEKAANNPAKFYYIHTDYLGSWLGVTNQQGSLTNHYSYDPWGRPRDPATWKLMPVSITNALADLSAMQPRFDRGYTGHEHMAGFGLINMNGRLYDPYLQRFLSPDDELQDPSNTQNYNRYTYCLNNPLRYTDPTGFDYGDDYPDDSGSGTGSWDGSTDAQLTPREQANWYTPSSSNGGFNNWNNNWGSWNNNSSQTCSLYFFVCRSTEYSTGYTDVYDSFDGTVSTEITYDHSGNVSSLFTWPSQSKTKNAFASIEDITSGMVGMDDPSITIKDGHEFFNTGGAEVDVYSTKTKEGKSPYELVFNTEKKLESVNINLMLGLKLSIGTDGSCSIGNNYFSFGTNTYDNTIIDISIPWFGENAQVGTTITMSNDNWKKIWDCLKLKPMPVPGFSSAGEVLPELIIP
jgi:RHS repeat-associated protein